MENELGTRVIFWSAIALLAAVIGKSGQFPLHTWLPDAMAGPTPVSSLLHSSTMVVAGVFLVARLYPVFWIGFSIPDGGINPLALIGGITILMSGILALVQVDIKKVLAYSTVGQLGYMIMGLGVGAWTPAVFHIFTHAFFKACLFLGAGSISHSASHHSFDMKKDMGGLWRKMPITFATFLISTLALTGVPFLSGFFSKDEIIDNAGHNGYEAFMIIGLIGAFFTTAYMARTLYLTFFGQARGASAGLHADPHDAHVSHDSGMAPTMEPIEEYEAQDDAHGLAHSTHAVHDAHAGPHESPALITVPLVLLGVLAVFSGYLNAVPPPFKWEFFLEWAEPISSGGTFPLISHAEFKWSKAMISIAIVAAAYVIGFGLSKMVYERKFLYGLTRRNPVAGALYRFVWNKYYLDHLYERVIARGVAYPLSRAAYWVNQHLLDGAINGTGKFSVGTGRWVYKWLDQRGVDGIVNGSGLTAKGAGGALRGTESGRIQQYASLLFGAAGIAAIALVLYVQAK
jgi:NADH-quinone oxidoreductase subunit L